MILFQVKWDASGSPWLAGRVQELLKQAGITCQTHHQRGLDHGVFVPLSLVYPKAHIPGMYAGCKDGRIIDNGRRVKMSLDTVLINFRVLISLVNFMPIKKALCH
jgi:aromatic ring-opening dioxygenase catalytic subunit (LigB family)